MSAEVVARKTVATNAAAISEFVLSMHHRTLPAEVMEATRFCIVDWFGTALGAKGQVPAEAIRRVVESWGAPGRAHVLLGKATMPAAAALVNGTMAHCLDFDDTHVGSIAHLTGPTWAAAFAVGTEINASPIAIVRAFMAGFEVGGRLGCGGFGVSLNAHQIHSTGVLGCLGAAVAGSMLYRLDANGIQTAIGLAATQVSGLTASFGTSAKPFHAGKAAFNGILAAQMAREGLDASLSLVEPGGGMERALVQDDTFKIQPLDFEEGWELTRNTFKPYAACLMTHPAIDAARALAGSLNTEKIERIVVRAHPFAIQMAGKQQPTTPFESKFSIGYCTAIALQGRLAMHTDFSASVLADASIRRLLGLVELVPDPSKALTASDLEISLAGGECVTSSTALALGNPGNPMSWEDLDRKFISLVQPVLGDRAGALLEVVKQLDSERDLGRVLGLVTPA